MVDLPKHVQYYSVHSNSDFRGFTGWCVRRMGLVVELPKHVRAPSAYEQHWIRYALGGVAAGYAATFVYR